MKKALAITLILVIVSAGVITYTTGSFQSALKKVGFVQTDYIGDIAAMDGVSLMLRSSLQRRQFWNIRADFTDGDVSYDVKTEFSQNAAKYVQDDSYCGVSMYPDAFVHYNFNSENSEMTKTYENLNEFEKMVYDYIRECPDTGSFQKRVRLSDYDGYYSFNVVFDIGAQGATGIFTFGENSYEEGSLEAEAFDAFKSYFRIPFAEDHYTTIHVEKDSGNLVMAGIYEEDDDCKTAYTGGYSTGTVGENACYFTISNRTNQGALLDTSLIPGGYGIYMLPYEIKGKGNVMLSESDFKFDELDTFVQLNEEAVVDNLAMSQDKSKLFVQYMLDDKLVVSTFDASTGELVKEVEVTEVSDDDWFRFYEGEGFYAVFNNSEITLLTENEDGALTPEFKAFQNSDFEFFPPFESLWNTKMEYDGSRLVIAGFAQIYKDKNGELTYTARYDNSYFVCAVSEDGILYFGAFESDLDKANLRDDGLNEEWDDFYGSSRNYSFNVGTWDSNAMTIQF